MGESTKAICSLMLIVGVLAGVIAWGLDSSGPMSWGFRIGGPLVAVLGLGAILAMHFRRDDEPDYLRSIARTYFNRDGFCFVAVANELNGEACIDIYYQSQYLEPSVGRVALRPARGFFMTRPSQDVIAVEIRCPPAGFGLARTRIPVPQGMQGKRVSFEVGASVSYPHGKGRRIRFHDGIFLRANSDFENSFGTALAVAGAATGSIVITKPATAKIELPIGVAENIPDDSRPEVRTLWKFGDPPLSVGV